MINAAHGCGCMKRDMRAVLLHITQILTLSRLPYIHITTAAAYYLQLHIEHWKLETIRHLHNQANGCSRFQYYYIIPNSVLILHSRFLGWLWFCALFLRARTHISGMQSHIYVLMYNVSQNWMLFEFWVSPIEISNGKDPKRIWCQRFSIVYIERTIPIHGQWL